MMSIRRALLKASVSLVFLPVPALAQMAAPQDQATTAPGSSNTVNSTTSPQGPAQVGQSNASEAPAQQGGLQEIVVTAQQRGENLQKAAVPVAAVSGADLINSNVRGLETIGSLVPSVSITSGSQGNLVFIRGIGNYSFTSGSEPAAAFNLDGVYVARSSSIYGNFYDLDRVEILKGPQGTLYGRNATAGAINVIPVQPRLGETSGYLVGSYGNYNAVTAEGAVNIGLGENAALRASATYTRHDGYLTDGTQRQNEGGGRLQLKVKLTPDLTVRISADYAHQGGAPGGTTYVASFTPNGVITPSGLPLNSGLFSAADQNYRTTVGTTTLMGRYQLPLTHLPFDKNSTYGVSVHIDYQTPIGTFSLLPAWRHARKDNVSTDSAGAVGDVQVDNTYSVEARLVSNPGHHFLDYILGAYYFSEGLNDDTFTNSSTTNSYLVSHYTTHSPAFYGRLTAHATDWLRFTGGLRYTQDHKTFNNSVDVLLETCAPNIAVFCANAPLLPFAMTANAVPNLPGPPGPFIIRFPHAGNAGSKSSVSKLNYRGAVEADVGPHSLLYASVETGYRAGGFNTYSTFDPETITAYTIGSKNRFLNNRLQLNVELFDWKYRNQQLSILGFEGNPPALGVNTHNVGRSTNKGVEVEGRALLTPTTTVSADVQYLKAKYDYFQYTQFGQSFTGCTQTPAGPPFFTVSCSGKPSINSPKWTINFGGQQVFPIGQYQLTVSADTQYRSGRYIGSDYISTEYINHVWNTNAAVSLGANDGKYVITAFVRNIENNRAPFYGSPAPASNLIVSEPSPPRLYGVRMSAKF